MRATRRTVLSIAAASLLPAPSLAQADQRPSLRVAVAKITNSNTLEPLRELSIPGTRAASLFAECMIEIDWQRMTGLVPGLAVAWRRIDQRTVELDLRPGVRFHNGAMMTADDVAFSFSEARMWSNAPASGGGAFLSGAAAGAGSKTPPLEVSRFARAAYPDFDRIDIVNAATVRFVNRVPDATLEGRLGLLSSNIVSRRGWDDAPNWLEWARRPVGTGPYRIREFLPDRELVLESHDEYWGGRPPLRQIRFIEVPELASRVNGLLAGDFDFALDISPDQIASIDRSPRHHVVGGAVANMRVTVFDKNHAVLANPLVRRAMTHAVDRQAIVDALWAGRTTIPQGMQWQFYGPMLLSDWQLPAFDPTEARRLLREAGYRGEEIPYQLLNNYYTNQTPTAQVLVEGWRQVGLNVVVDMKENFGQVLAPGPRRGICDNSYGAGFNDPVGALRSFGPGGQPWETGQWRNVENARLLAELSSEFDLERRRAIFRRMLTIIEREDPCYSMMHQNASYIAKRRDLRWQPSQNWQMDFRGRNWS